MTPDHSEFNAKQEKLAILETRTPEVFGAQNFSGLYRAKSGSIYLFRFLKTVPANGMDASLVVEHPTIDNLAFMYEGSVYDRKKKEFVKQNFTSDIKDKYYLEGLIGDYTEL